MILSAITFLGLLALSNARPNAISPNNVVVVPPNCPPGQAWVNGKCRDVWIFGPVQIILPESDSNSAMGPQNVVVVPPNCPPGQAYVNGQCRDVWRLKNTLPKTAAIEYEALESKAAKGPQNVVVVPPNCPPGQAWVNGQCRDVWRLSPAPIVLPKPMAPVDFKQEELELTPEFEASSVITVPNQCPTGYKPDAHGICRKIF
ncbi:hypothetical protein ABMA27_014039 [Loxostege sticticalis]|uniref:Uncharacterized protein n=1 Tax=Loxostege sticticalis TaxID=481309 RepID=A0ABR3ICJ1_LOXSC